MEAFLANIQSIIVFLIVLSALIIVHEWGHFATAKELGIKVERFSVGFGPKLWSTIHRGTEFMVCAIPLGGYVKMAGDERGQCKGAPDEFYSKSPGHRALVVLNGPLVNFVMAYLCLVAVFMLGFPDLSTKVGEAMTGYPAYEAGLRQDDRILTINEQLVTNWTELQKNISESTTNEITVTYERSGVKKSASLMPKTEVRKNIFGQEQRVRLVGIRPAEDIILQRYAFFESMARGWDKLVEITVMTYKSLYFMATGSVSAKESVTGPIGIFFIVKSAAEMGFSHLLLIVGIISASLAIFNLLPIIPLDGGHLFLLAIEKIRGRALPARIDDYIARLGFSFIILLALFVFYSDFARFGWIDNIKNLFP